MTMEWTMQLPVIKWTPLTGAKKVPVAAKTEMKLEEMSLSELLFLAVGPAR